MSRAKTGHRKHASTMAKKQKHILIADDDPVYRDVATEALEKAGHRITQAVDGGHAITLLGAEVFDAAILDLTMPVADGIAVIQHLRSGALNTTIPVIVITGHDDSTAVERAYLAGATSFLTKPLNWVLFTPHVEFVLRSGQTENDLREANAATAFLSELKSQMMSSLAQEFQTPIKTIFGFSELIYKEVYGPLAPPAYRDMMSEISKSANNLNAALLKLMNFGRTLTEQLEMKVEAIKVRDAVLDALDAMDSNAQRRDVRIAANVAIASEVMILADRALLSQALRSILDNAIRLSPRGGEVQLVADIGADGGLTVSVSDLGPPMPDELLDDVNGGVKVQKTFARQQETRDVSVKIAKVLAEAHKGSLTIKSDTSGGNHVRLELPRDGRKKEVKPPDPPNNLDALKRLAVISGELADDLRLKGKLSGTSTTVANWTGRGS